MAENRSWRVGIDHVDRRGDAVVSGWSRVRHEVQGFAFVVLRGGVRADV